MKESEDKTQTLLESKDQQNNHEKERKLLCSELLSDLIRRSLIKN
jgi:hypothetical protein